MRYTYRHRTLRPLALSVHIWFLANSIVSTVFAVFVLRELDLAPWAFGVTLAFGGVGGFLGALLAPRIGAATRGGEGDPLGPRPRHWAVARTRCGADRRLEGLVCRPWRESSRRLDGHPGGDTGSDRPWRRRPGHARRSNSESSRPRLRRIRGAPRDILGLQPDHRSRAFFTRSGRRDLPAARRQSGRASGSETRSLQRHLIDAPPAR